MKFALGRVENIVEKGENAGYQHFLLFPQCFQKFLSFTEVSGLSDSGLTVFCLSAVYVYVCSCMIYLVLRVHVHIENAGAFLF